MHRYAQTNLQLYAQLDAAGWTESELAVVARGYELALQVCGASIRPNGKPFLCHLVGTASIVASWDAPRDEVVCGLVHSVYTHGVWADSSPEEKAAAVRTAVGGECEALVAEYTGLPWTSVAIEKWAVAVDSLSPRERVAIRVRLANELEDHLDLGMRFSRKTKSATSAEASGAMLALADRLVSHELSEELAAAIAENAAGPAPTVLVRDARASFRPALT